MMEQKCVRTYDRNRGTHSDTDCCEELNSYLKDGWTIVCVTSKADFIEYIIKREVNIDRKLAKAKELIKKFSEFINDEAKFDLEYPEYSQEHADMWKELCEEVDQFIKENE